MSNEWDGGRRRSGEQNPATGRRGASPGGSTPSSRRYAGVPVSPAPTGAEPTVQRKTTADAWASLASREVGQRPSAFDPFDVGQLDHQPWRAQVAPTPIQRKQTLEPAADPVQDRSLMVSAGRSPVQRSASMSAIDVPRADSVGEDRTTIGAAPAPATAGAELDISKAESLREDRATIAADEASTSGPLAPELAARAAAKNARLVSTHGIGPADFGTDAAPDSAAFAQAVAQFQGQHGLNVDGIVGPKTAAAVRDSADPSLASGRPSTDSSAPTTAAETDSRGTGSSLLQMKTGADAASEADVHRAAEAGFAGSGQPLPYRDTIQQSFGGHDLASVTAHVGGPATDAAGRIGAVAYATGSKIAFSGPPDLHTAAHEAAHVVQQRAGVHLKGGVGQAGDTYEQHADAVADKVVRGESAEELLGPVGSAERSPSVQRRPATDQAGEPAPLLTSDNWDVQHGHTMDSFLPIILEANRAVGDWKDKELVDAPASDDWRNLLITIGSLAFAGVAGLLATSLTGAIRAAAAGAARKTAASVGATIAERAITAGQGALTSAVSENAKKVSDKPKHEQKLVAVDFASAQLAAVTATLLSMKSHSRAAAGSAARPGLSIEQLQRIQSTNHELAARIHDQLTREIVIGWMNLVWGGKSMRDADLGEDGSSIDELGNSGALALELSSSNGMPLISSARAHGVGPGQKSLLAGKPVSYWLAPEAAGSGPVAPRQGVNLILLAKRDAFRVSSEIHRELMSLGAYGTNAEIEHGQRPVPGFGRPPQTANRNHLIHFGYGRSSTGVWSWVTDYQGWMVSDTATGWRAGRAYVDTVLGGPNGLLRLLHLDIVPEIA